MLPKEEGCRKPVLGVWGRVSVCRECVFGGESSGAGKKSGVE